MKYLICDIDGTIADCKHRLHYLKKKDWDSFYDACDKDKPIEPVVSMLQNLWPYYKIIFLTGRRTTCRGKTLNWINEFVVPERVKNTPVQAMSEYGLLMRANGDKRHDIWVKPELLANNYDITPDSIAFILEDRNAMVRKWRAMGFTTLQVAEGDF